MGRIPGRDGNGGGSAAGPGAVGVQQRNEQIRHAHVPHAVSLLDRGHPPFHGGPVLRILHHHPLPFSQFSGDEFQSLQSDSRPHLLQLRLGTRAASHGSVQRFLLCGFHRRGQTASRRQSRPGAAGGNRAVCDLPSAGKFPGGAGDIPAMGVRSRRRARMGVFGQGVPSPPDPVFPRYGFTLVRRHYVHRSVGGGGRTPRMATGGIWFGRGTGSGEDGGGGVGRGVGGPPNRLSHHRGGRAPFGESFLFPQLAGAGSRRPVAGHSLFDGGDTHRRGSGDHL